MEGERCGFCQPLAGFATAVCFHVACNTGSNMLMLDCSLAACVTSLCTEKFIVADSFV